ncbi:dickkopf-related protein 3 isoform X2 [Microcaecilia unicolor]|uniref:Dickkopf-related protein 3 n=1 Tax=Microcaecilia unicolor TaxID=1415580 RepID=A0A6P7XNA4_9AMPH|nr:dickkopf-related protein 3 isoform X2 [Microcaecilia unicolor]
MLQVVLLVLSLALGSVDPTPARSREDEVGEARNFSLGEATLSELLQEVEELMEDTEHKLQNAVKEIEAEEENAARKMADVDFENLPPSYHNESNTETKIGNKTIHTHQEINKLTDNKTGSTIYSETVITSIKGEDNKRNQECMIDDDCDNGKYCRLGNFEYKCLPCITQDCSRDGECCGGKLCVWGQCTQAASKGENGTICESQQECNPGLCCAIHKNLLFPVCTPLPLQGEFCHDSSNKIPELIAWQLEPDGVLDHCPCATGLYCRPQRHGLISICDQVPLNGTRDTDMEILLAMEAFPFLDGSDDLEADKIIQEVNNELIDHERSISEQMDPLEPDFIPDIPFEDEI